jgi:preprotein translocase subunit SecF
VHGRAGHIFRALNLLGEPQVELFKGTTIDWLAKKWIFFGISWALILIGVIGYFVRGGFAYGIDFSGGTIVILKFSSRPDVDRIRSAIRPDSGGTPIIQTYDDPSKNTVQVRLPMVLGGADGSTGHQNVQGLLRQALDPAHAGSSKLDFNNVGSEAVQKFLIEADPDGYRKQSKTTQETEEHYRQVAAALLAYRDKVGEGLVPSLDALRSASGVSGAVVDALGNGFYAGPFAIKAVESVGAIVGADLRRRAALAVGLSFLGMLIYIGLRFKPIYGVAAIVALFHDVAITLGLFAVTQKEISLTVIAALLTLVGYSVNDTIVIFDRVRENLRTMRKESLQRVINLSINQTLSRTILTSGFTFLSVLALLLFGGEVLNGFAFALTVGIIVGTYSTVGIAGPIVEFWYRVGDQRPKRKAA